ncbi:hypothetical protein AGIG_G5136 [Arapaima gigas]
MCRFSAAFGCKLFRRPPAKRPRRSLLLQHEPGQISAPFPVLCLPGVNIAATPSNAEAQRQVLQCPVAVEESKAASAGVPGETEVRSAEVVSSGDNRQMTRCASGPLFRPASARWKVLVQMQLLLKFTLYSPENHLTTRFHSWSFMESAPTGKLERYGCSLLHTFMF